MNRNRLLLAFGLVTALLLAGCATTDAPVAAVPDGARAGELAGWEACEYQPADSKTVFPAECGTLVVPENWEKAGSRPIALPVVRIPASGPHPAEPVFYLQGGPGQSNLSWAPPAWLLEKHAVVFVGYRGLDGTVRLACPELGRLIKAHLGKDLFSEQARTEYAGALNQCAADHQEAGVDLQGYTVPGVIRDMEAARTALGYERVNLLSESYGTRVAQLYAYMYPGSLHRLVLIGVNTPGHFHWDPAVLDEMIGQIGELCARDAECSRRTGDFARAMHTVNHDMPQRWLFFNIDPDTVRLGAHFMFLDNRNMALVFDAYLAAAAGDPSGLAMLNLMSRLMFPAESFVFGDTASKAGTLDGDRYGGLESISLGSSIMGAPMAELIWPIMDEWPLLLAPDELRAFQESEVEMLLINGSLDFATPPNALDEARPYYRRAQMVLLPEFSHITDVMSALQPQAFERLVTSYYDTGVGDTSLYAYEPLPFKPGISLTTLARLLVAAAVLLPALLVLGLWVGISRLRKRRKVQGEMEYSNDLGFTAGQTGSG